MSKSSVWLPWSPVGGRSLPLTIVAGSGSHVQDDAGRWYLDGVAGSLNASCGHGNQYVIAALSEQLNKLMHYDLTVACHPAAVRLAARIAGLLPGELADTLFLNSGSEANEAALCIALQYWRNIGRPRSRVITFRDGYHGTTAITKKLSGLPYARSDWALPFPIDHVELPVPPARLRTRTALTELLARFEALISRGEPVAAVMVEALLNVGGGVVLPAGTLAGLRALCDKYGALLIVDEIFCGFGRTGLMFGFEHDAVTPDIVTMSKGISGGYVPLSAVTTAAQIKESFREEPLIAGLRYGHTTSGHAVACAAALAVLDLIDGEGLVAHSARLGDVLLSRLLADLADIPIVVDVRGLGLVTVVETDSFDTGLAVVAAARQLGLLVRQQGPCVMVVPPLTITADEAVQVTERLAEAVRRTSLTAARSA